MLLGSQAGGHGLLKSSELADIVVLPLAGEADFIGSLGQAFSFVYAFYTCVAAGFVVAYGIVGLELLGIGELAMEGLFSRMRFLRSHPQLRL